MLTRVAVFVFATCALAGCQGGQRSPSAPGEAGGTGAGGERAVTAQEVALQWSPYVGVHADGQALPAYRDALSALQRVGRLNGVRMEIHRNEPVNPVIKAAGAMGLEILGLVSNDNLFDPDIEGAIDRIFARVPGDPLLPDRERDHDDPAGVRADDVDRTVRGGVPAHLRPRPVATPRARHPADAVGTRVGPARADGARDARRASRSRAWTRTRSSWRSTRTTRTRSASTAGCWAARSGRSACG